MRYNVLFALNVLTVRVQPLALSQAVTVDLTTAVDAEVEKDSVCFRRATADLHGAFSGLMCADAWIVLGHKVTDYLPSALQERMSIEAFTRWVANKSNTCARDAGDARVIKCVLYSASSDRHPAIGTFVDSTLVIISQVFGPDGTNDHYYLWRYVLWRLGTGQRSEDLGTIEETWRYRDVTITHRSEQRVSSWLWVWEPPAKPRGRRPKKP